MNGEEWRRFRETQYSVSTLGRVRNDITGRILSPVVQRRETGHPTCARVQFGTRKNRISYRVSSMVLEVFKHPKPQGKECCHRNGDPVDNRLSNLYWGTHTQNMRDASRHGTLRDTTAKGSQHVNAKLCDVDVERARDLRRQGFSVNNIRSWLQLPIAEATLWRILHKGRYANA